MELIIPEGALGLNIASGFIYCDHTVGDDPFRRGRAVLRRHPLVQILAVEQDDCVRGRCSAGSAWRYHLRLRMPDFGVFRFGCGLLGVERDSHGDENHEREKVPHLCTLDVQEHTPKVESKAVGILRRFLLGSVLLGTGVAAVLYIWHKNNPVLQPPVRSSITIMTGSNCSAITLNTRGIMTSSTKENTPPRWK